MSKELQVEGGRRAEIALQELNKAFEQLEKDCFATFKESDVHDIEGHQTCRMYLRVMEDIKDRFELAVNNGKAASKALVRLGAENPSTP